MSGNGGPGRSEVAVEVDIDNRSLMRWKSSKLSAGLKKEEDKVRSRTSRAAMARRGSSESTKVVCGAEWEGRKGEIKSEGGTGQGIKELTRA